MNGRRVLGAGPVLLWGLLTLGAPRALAQEAEDAAATELPEGTEARVTREGFQAEGQLLPGTATTLRLQTRFEPVLEVPLAQVERLEVMQRRGATGALIGSEAGGLGLGGLAAYLYGNRIEESSPGNDVAFGLLGGAVGAAGGALLGLVVGEMFSGWETAWARSRDRAPLSLVVEPQEGPEGAQGLALDLALKLGGAWRVDANRLEGHESGPGAQLQLLARLGPYFAVGPEAAYYAFTDLAPGTFPGIDQRQRQLLQLGAVTRLGVQLGRLRPALLVGGALYQPNEDFLLGYSVGAELELIPGLGGLALTLDTRVHRLERDPLGHGQTYLGAGAGAAWRW